MHPNAQLIDKFYSAFQRKDAEAMAACYHPQVHFSDPVFPELRGEQAADMWRMLCSRSADLEIQYREVEADDSRGSAHWDARYTFTATGRKVLNRIDARFEFQEGKILRHADRFSFYRWASQALGPMGMALGWTPLVRNKVRKMAGSNLASFRAKRGAR